MALAQTTETPIGVGAQQRSVSPWIAKQAPNLLLGLVLVLLPAVANDFILDQSFGIPIAPSTSRVITRAAVHGLEFRFNDVMWLGNTWMG